MCKTIKSQLRALWYLVIQNFMLKWTAKPRLRGARDEEDCTGKVFVVTGANSGIGKATCLELAKRGATVVMGCRDLVKGQEAINQIRQNLTSTSTHQPHLHLVQLDLIDFQSVRSFAEKVKETFGKVDVLINNAGYYCNKKIEITEGGTEIHFCVNYLGHFLLTKLLLPHMLSQQPKGRVVNISSINAMLSIHNEDFLNDLTYERRNDLGWMGTGPYNDSKLALCLFTKELAKRYPGINSYSIFPGVIKTNVFQNSTSFYQFIISASLPFLAITPLQASEAILYNALSAECEEETGYCYKAFKKFHEMNCFTFLKFRLSERLWEMSENLVASELT